MFNLANVEALDIGASDLFSGRKPMGRFDVTSLLTRLTTLTLSLFELTINNSSPTHPPHLLPYLTTLTLHKVNLRVPLHQCLKLPRLRNLSLSEVGHVGEGAPWMLKKANDTAIRLLESFFQGIPELETLALLTFPLNVRMVTALQALPRLAELTIGGCSINNSLLLIVEPLMDEKSFPSLVSFNIGFDVLERNIHISYKAFVERCRIKRPKLALCPYKHGGSRSTKEDL
jgi:hypothetical protein